ncbi:MAG: DUF3795 domain-containing protein [Promethearchaeota archaeon]
MSGSHEDEWDISFCGLNCAKCDMYLASHGDDQLHEELVSWFQENIDPNIKSISCERCRGETSECWSDDCEFRPCVIEKGLNYCFECPDFVCDKLEDFANEGLQHHKRTVENLKKMKERGLEKWKANQKEASFCP